MSNERQTFLPSVGAGVGSTASGFGPAMALADIRAAIEEVAATAAVAASVIDAFAASPAIRRAAAGASRPTTSVVAEGDGESGELRLRSSERSSLLRVDGLQGFGGATGGGVRGVADGGGQFPIVAGRGGFHQGGDPPAGQ